MGASGSQLPVGGTHIPAKAVPGRAQTSLRALQSEVRVQGCREGATTPASRSLAGFRPVASLLAQAWSAADARTESESEAARRRR